VTDHVTFGDCTACGCRSVQLYLVAVWGGQQRIGLDTVCGLCADNMTTAPARPCPDLRPNQPGDGRIVRKPTT
jgi:hypothetical protein